MHGGIVGEHRDLVFDDPRPPVSLSGRQAEAVPMQRPCQNVPKLAEILRGVAGKGARTNKRITARSTSGCKGSPDSSQRIRMLGTGSFCFSIVWKSKMTQYRILPVRNWPSAVPVLRGLPTSTKLANRGHQISSITGIIMGRRPVVFWIRRFNSARTFSLTMP